MRIKHLLSFLILISFLGSGCQEKEKWTPTMGMIPVYIPESEAFSVGSEAPQPIKNLGKLYIKDSLLFMTELNEGIHIYDNSDPANPSPIGFIRVAGNKDLAIRNKSLYIDNFYDLVTIDISDINNPIEVARVKKAFSETPYIIPSVDFGFFECVDLSKGFPYKWIDGMVYEPACRMQFR
jgi:hypothetical protein